MKKYFPLLLLIYAQLSFSQTTDTLTLDFCQKKALENYPLIQQKDLLNKASEINLLNISKTYMPQLSLNGQATYQSDVTTLPIHIPGIQIPSLDKDMYKATFDVTQLIYDGGLTNKEKQLENISLKADQQSLETELYKIKDKVNTIFFEIAALQSSKNLLSVLKDDIKNKLTLVESGVENGTLLESNADILKAEIIKNDQQIIELESGIEAGFKMLADYTNLTLATTTPIKLPQSNLSATDYEIARPENKAYDLQQQKLSVSQSLLDCKLMPKVAAFGELGYGRPGLNMLSNSFDPFYLIGAKVSWTFWDWNQTKNEKQLLTLQSDVIATQKDAFNQGIKILMEKNIADIKQYQDLMTKDEEIITLQGKIIKESASQLENGIITSTEYLTQLNAEAQAKINLESHKIELSKAWVDYLTMKGK